MGKTRDTELGLDSNAVVAEDTELGAADEGQEDTNYVPPTDEDTLSILSIIPNEHDRIKGLYRRYKDPTDSPQQRQSLANQLLQELHAHMLAEEQVVYPVVAEEIEEHMRDHAVDEHDSLKLFSNDLYCQKIDDEGFEDKMHQLMETFLEHIHEEEHKMLHALRDVLEEPQLRELGKQFEAAKQRVPARRDLSVGRAKPTDDIKGAAHGLASPAGADSTAVPTLL